MENLPLEYSFPTLYLFSGAFSSFPYSFPFFLPLPIINHQHQFIYFPNQASNSQGVLVHPNELGNTNPIDRFSDALTPTSLPSLPFSSSPPSLPPPPPPQTILQYHFNPFPYMDSQANLVPISKHMPTMETLLTLAPPTLLAEQINVIPPTNPPSEPFIQQPLDKVVDSAAENRALRRGGRQKRGPKPVKEPKQIKNKEPRRWTDEEDKVLKGLVRDLGEHWAKIGKLMKSRRGKQCRERWNNHLRPNIKKDTPWTKEEEETIVEVHKNEGTKWAKLCKILHGRTENSIKNHWNSTKRKVVSNSVFIESSPLQRYIGHTLSSSSCKPLACDLDNSDHSSLDENSGKGPSSRADGDPVAETIEEARNKSVVLMNFFA